MDPESRKLLEETLELAKENNKLLHYMKRTMRVSTIVTFIYWIFIIGTVFGAYYLIEPYLSQLMDVSSDVLNNMKQIGQ